MLTSQFLTADTALVSSDSTLRDPALWCELHADINELLSSIAGEWVTSRPAAVRRSEVRRRCDYPGWITPLDETAHADVTLPAAVRISTVSRRGIGLVHSGPLPHKIVAVRFALDESPSPELVVRLQWCRFRGPGAYESGGRIQCLLGENGITRADR